jgi:ABC-2 type transport system ATP-binding protein
LQPRHVQYIGYLPEEEVCIIVWKWREQCLYLAQMKGLSKAEAKNNWTIGLEIQGWWNKKTRTF